MQTRFGYPPNYLEIKKRLRPPPNAIFCYGDTVYMPAGGELTLPLAAHENVHRLRQGDQVEAWWACYLMDVLFRIKEELLAHVAEYTEVLAHNPNRHTRRRYMKMMCRRLSGPMYGRGISMVEAKTALTDGVFPERFLD